MTFVAAADDIRPPWPLSQLAALAQRSIAEHGMVTDSEPHTR